MLAPLSWLREFVPVEAGVDEVVEGPRQIGRVALEGREVAEPGQRDEHETPRSWATVAETAARGKRQRRAHRERASSASEPNP